MSEYTPSAELPRELEEALQKRSPEARQQLQRLWERLGTLEPPLEDVPSTEAAWQALRERLDTMPRPARPPRRMRRYRWPMVASVLLVLGLIGYVWLRPRTLVVPPGTIQALTLADGSTITLRGGSQLQYTLILPWERPRRIRLTGEALFEVVPGRPLTVETAQARVEVLGTRFNVRAWPEMHETRVTLLKGRVRVQPIQAPQQTMVLERPGQSLRVGLGKTATPEQLAPEQVLAWQQGGFVVIDEPVAVVLRELERAFALRIEVRGSLPLEQRMTVLYQQPVRPEVVLQDLCLTLPCHYRRISRGFAVEAAPPSGY